MVNTNTSILWFILDKPALVKPYESEGIKHYILFTKEFFCFEFREISIRISFMEAFPKIIHCFFENAIFFEL